MARKKGRSRRPPGNERQVQNNTGVTEHSEVVEDFLTDPPEDALTFEGEDPVTQAEARFQGADPPNTCLRGAFLAIASAQGYSAAVAARLASLRRTAVADPEELEDSLYGWTVIEGDLAEAAAELTAALEACRGAVRSLRRARASRRRRRKPAVAS